MAGRVGRRFRIMALRIAGRCVWPGQRLRGGAGMVQPGVGGDCGWRGNGCLRGAVNLYKCTLEPGQQPPNTACTQGDWINLTHVYGCNPGPLGAPAHVHPDQHGIAFLEVGGTSPGYFAHDGGISRTLDGYSGLNAGSCSGTNQFDSLSQTLGSMTEFVSFSVDATNATSCLGERRGMARQKPARPARAAHGRMRWVEMEDSRRSIRRTGTSGLRPILTSRLRVRSRNGLRRRLVCSDCRIERLGRRPGGFQYSLYFGSAECERDAGGDVPGVVDHDEWSGSGAVE